MTKGTRAAAPTAVFRPAQRGAGRRNRAADPRRTSHRAYRPRTRPAPFATVGWRLALLAYFDERGGEGEDEGEGEAEDALPPASLPPTARAALAAAVRRAAAARVGPASAGACVDAFEANWTAFAAGEAVADALDDEGDRAELDALVARHGLVPGHYGDLEQLHVVF